MRNGTRLAGHIDSSPTSLKLVQGRRLSLMIAYLPRGQRSRYLSHVLYFFKLSFCLITFDERNVDACVGLHQCRSRRRFLGLAV
jgi:hypothetical protein